MRNTPEPDLLPGGIIREGNRLRGFIPAPLSGRVELALCLGPEPGARFHERLTRAIALGIECIGDEPMTESLAADLAIGDRQFLARVLGAGRLGDQIWLSPECPHCGSRFDLSVRQAELPVKPAGDGFPVTTVRLSAGTFRCRVPTGRDQLALTSADAADARRWLLDRVIEDAPPGFTGAADLDDDDLARADASLENASPEVGTIVETACPSCGRPAQIEVSPYLGLLRGEDDLLHEVHQIAGAYHWSQAEILDLPTARRRRYLSLIDHSRGVRA